MLKIKILFEKTAKCAKETLRLIKLCFLSFKNKQIEKFKININTNCLVLAQYPGAETKALGGLLAQYPKNFEVLCFTNGSSLLSNLNPIDSAAHKKTNFQEVMKSMRIKGFKVFDIDSNSLKNHYATFRKIDISEADYIFIPNLCDKNPDSNALVKHFKQLLKEKEYKNTLQVVMFESDLPLSIYNKYADISSTIELKKKFISEYYSNSNNYIDKIVGLNSFRALEDGFNYKEVFLSLTVEEFQNLTIDY